MRDMTPTAPTREGWVILLHGDTEFLDRTLAYYLSKGPVRVFNRENQFYLQADEIDVQPDFRSAEQQALKLLRTICGLFGVVATPQEARPIAAIPRGADGHWGEPIRFVHAINVSMSLSVSVRPPVCQTDRSQRALGLALRDKRVRWALDDFAGEPDFPRLRRVYETMWQAFDKKQGRAERKIVANGLATRADLKRFSDTVNRGSKEAAHSTFGQKPYAGAMSLMEARSYLGDLLNRWIDSRL
jgi:hypothetical protein